MTSSPSSQNYKLKVFPEYLRNFKEMKKEETGNKAKSDFALLVASVVEAIGAAPRQMRGHSFDDIEKFEPEPWPQCFTNRTGLEFWKAFFTIKWRKKSDRHGRIMYLIHEEEKTIYLVMMYTHKKYESRPSDQNISFVVKQGLKSTDGDQEV